MNTEPEDVIVTRPSAPAAAAAAGFAAAAVKVAAVALRRQPAEHQQALRRAVDAGTCTLIVQTDLPSGDVVVLADHAGGLGHVLLHLEPRESGGPLPLTLAARVLVDQGLAQLAPDARGRLLAALDDGQATCAVLCDLPACDLRVLAYAEWWIEPEEVLRVTLPVRSARLDA